MGTSALEVQEVQEVLVKAARQLLSLFGYWAGANTTPAMASASKTDSWLVIQWGAFMRLVAEHRIADESNQFCQEKDAAILFEALNADDGMAAKDSQAAPSGPGNGSSPAGKDVGPSPPSNRRGGKGKGRRRVAKAADKKALDRREFLQAMLRLAVMKFVKSGEEVRSERRKLTDRHPYTPARRTAPTPLTPRSDLTPTCLRSPMSPSRSIGSSKSISSATRPQRASPTTTTSGESMGRGPSNAAPSAHSAQPHSSPLT